MLLLRFLLFRRDYLGRVVFRSFLSIVLQIYPIQSLEIILSFGRAIVVWGERRLQDGIAVLSNMR